MVPAMSIRALSILAIAGLAFLSPAAGQDSPAETAQSILQATGVTGGFIVHLGSGDGQLTAALRAGDSYLVHGLDPDPEKVKASRRALLARGIYGPVSIDRLGGDRLPYTSGTVNLIVAESADLAPEAEIRRVLTPRGVAYVKGPGGQWTKSVQPVPGAIDDWTHFLHSAGGNAVSHDTVVGPPRRFKWVGSPRWSRHHDRMASMSALVSEKGRLFYIMDEGSRISIELPSKWKLISRDAFNGTVLWKRDIPNWHNHLWPLKSGPTQLARRLVAMDDYLFCTMGIVAPVSVLDAVTGKTIREFEGSGGAEEFVVANGIAYLIVMKEERELADFLPLHNTGDQARVRTEYQWNEQSRLVMAFDVETGAELWHKVSRVSPLTIAADDDRVYYHDGEKVLALDGKTGEQVWAGGEADRKEVINFNFGPKLVITQGKVLFAGGDRLMHTYDALTGKELWSAPHARGGYQSPEDLLVLQGKVWSAALTSGKDDGIFTGRDLVTGEVKAEFPPSVETYWFHHRCYIAKATDRYIMPSRTGIEFVDPDTEKWEIHHWVRGGCLYGVMPCNGLTYAPPNNCVCYPETKLYGFNALAPAPENDDDITPDPIPERFEKGPAFGSVPGGDTDGGEDDWPTFRHDNTRSGATGHTIAADKLKPSWTADLGGRLSSVVVAGGLAFVSQIDQHTVHALDSKTGKPVWSFTAGGRVDSPPAIHEGAAFFGSADGWVYCVRAKDGELAWRFRAAPQDRRMMAFEQLESNWPVHGNVLIENGQVYAVAGRSNFLDGGLRMYRLDPASGKMLGETVIDEINPETGGNIQDRIQTLQMPAGLPDILSASGGYIYMRSQQFDLDCNRLDLGPHSGDAPTNAAVQAGEGRHLFAPMSFLDDSWYHRSYWVYGRSFSGGHNGYFQAAKNTPSGRILVFGKDKVYGFGRKPEYLKWTTTMEHQLFSAPLEAPEGALSAADDQATRRQASPKQGASGLPMIDFGSPQSLDPTGKAISMEAWVKVAAPDGVVIARGGPAQGFALIVREGIPRFIVRVGSEMAIASGKEKLGGEWTHLAAVLGEDLSMRLFVNGQIAGKARASSLLQSDPKQGLQIGGDEGSAVGEYKSPYTFNGLIDEARLYFGELSPEEIAARAADPADTTAANATVVMSCSFDDGAAGDRSGLGNHGSLGGNVNPASNGVAGGAMRFPGGGKKGARNAGSIVQFDWTQDIPLLARAMAKTGDILIAVGPPDLIDEEEAFVKLTEGDQEVEKQLAEQDAALLGNQGAILWAVSTEDGAKQAELKLPSMPVWDGLAIAEEKVFIATTDGKVLCFGE